MSLVAGNGSKRPKKTILLDYNELLLRLKTIKDLKDLEVIKLSLESMIDEIKTS